MERYGFIRGKDDIKFLILNSLSYIKFYIDFDNIYDICTWCDEGFDYFEFNEAFLELVESNHLEENDNNQFLITEKGLLTAKEFENRLPASVKDIVNMSALRVTKEIRRNTHIKAKTTKISDVDYVVNMEMEDVFSLNFNVTSHDQAALIESQFKKNAEKIYDDILNSLIKEY